MDQILQDQLPTAPWMAEATRRLPGMQPLAEGEDWLQRDEAFAAQMALRDRLVRTRPGEVIADVPGSDKGTAELYERVLAHLRQDAGYTWADTSCRRPDGVEVTLEPTDPLGTLARLVQQDLCLLEKPAGAREHVLTAAILCFPASWSLHEKIGRPLTTIHDPVSPYDARMAGRVQRLFDHLRVDTALWRQNALIYRDPRLFQPRRQADPRMDRDGGGFLRSERQTIMRLKDSRAVVFSIHTYVVALDALTEEQRAGLGEVAHPT
ncbi:DUF3445 domain-containing protein [Hasllibacter sp. MH4015]|uniref:heme-dependent oxidative N-demethylase family protein n=1 Tax=Hasllibacter sp. MH4015 TaxID=2854029 RepID=UPI001CD35D95|nr:DUF3445 domain-containing protein [Hasllibacter sp. MH4015]